MKVTLIPQFYEWILMRIETDIVCIEVNISPVFPPFKEMYTWLGRIKDRQLPTEMIIDEEGYGVILIAKQVQEKIEFSIRDWLKNEDTIYLKTIIEPDTLVKCFQNEIVDTIDEQFNETKQSFIVKDGNLNWNSLLKKSENPQDWHKRLAIYGEATGKYPETNLNNFSLTSEQEYLVQLKNGLYQVYRLTSYVNKKQLGALISFYQELAVDITLGTVDPDWYQYEKERLNKKYKINDSLKSKTIQESIEKRNKSISLRQARLKTLRIGQIVDGTIVGCRDYGFFVDIGGICALLHISNISRSPIEDIQKVFEIQDWTRAVIADLDIEKGRVSLSTKDLELEPGQILIEPWTVYQNVEIMAEKYSKTRLEGD